MISSSKYGYCQEHPNNLAVFNANVCIDEGKIWYGDIDVTKSQEKIQELANIINKKVYILFEMDARFETELNPSLDSAAVVFSPNEEPQIAERIRKYYRLTWNY